MIVLVPQILHFGLELRAGMVADHAPAWIDGCVMGMGNGTKWGIIVVCTDTVLRGEVNRIGDILIAIMQIKEVAAGSLEE